MNQVDDDLHRVLQLARAQSRLHAAKSSRGRGNKLKSSSSRHALERHRHNGNDSRRLCSQPPLTLMNAKLKGIAALNDLENTIPKLSDCSKTAIRHAQQAASTDNDEDAALRDDEAKLVARCALYKHHYSDLQAPYSPRGLPKLKCLLDAAQQAKTKMARHSALPLGASVLTSGNRIYASCTIESVQHDAKFTICAERAAIMKALGEDPDEVVTAMAICSDQKGGLLPFPCGTCREFMAGCGDFPVFLVNGECVSEETRSFALFPCARQTQTADVAQQGAQTDQQLRSGKSSASTRADVGDARRSKSKLVNNDDNNEENLPLEVSEWRCGHVLQWLANDVELPQYRDVFARNGVDGCMLLHLQDCDLQLLLGIVQPLHRKRMLVHIDRLKDRALLEHGVDYGQLQDYLAVLDRDRIAVVAQLKATFDRLDQNRDGLLDFHEVKHALRRLGCDASAQAVEALLRGEILHNGDDSTTNDRGNVSFVRFATAFSSLAIQPASEDHRQQQQPQRWRVPEIDLDGLRCTFAEADRDNSGRIDAQELVELFRSLETTKSGDDKALAEKACTWLQQADGDGDNRLSFAEFLVRYLQLTKAQDLSKLQSFFESTEPVNVTYHKPMIVLRRALETFFPEFSLPEISVWYKRHLNSNLLRTIVPEAEADSSDAPFKSAAHESGGDVNMDEHQTATSTSTAAKPSTLTISLADFVLAVFLFQEHTRERQKHERAMQTTMSNDALAHKSRIVHLQQSGHVRICPQSTASLAETRRQQQQQKRTNSPRPRRDEAENEAKHDSTDEEREEPDDDDRKKTHRKLASQLVRVDATFDRFAKAKVEAPKAKTQRRQHSESDDDVVSSRELNALEAVQAMTELGISCPRAQMLRLLKDEGFGLHDCIGRRDF